MFYGTGDLFETMSAQDRPKQRPKTASFYSDFSELKPGDYVVHMDHGIGRFEGLQTIESAGRAGEFMRLSYADEARLYVPATQRCGYGSAVSSASPIARRSQAAAR